MTINMFGEKAAATGLITPLLKALLWKQKTTTRPLCIIADLVVAGMN